MSDKNINNWGLVRGSTTHSLVTQNIDLGLSPPAPPQSTVNVYQNLLLWHVCKTEALQLTSLQLLRLSNAPINLRKIHGTVPIVKTRHSREGER